MKLLLILSYLLSSANYSAAQFISGELPQVSGELPVHADSVVAYLNKNTGLFKATETHSGDGMDLTIDFLIAVPNRDRSELLDSLKSQCLEFSNINGTDMEILFQNTNIVASNPDKYKRRMDRLYKQIVELADARKGQVVNSICTAAHFIDKQESRSSQETSSRGSSCNPANETLTGPAGFYNPRTVVNKQAKDFLSLNSCIDFMRVFFSDKSYINSFLVYSVSPIPDNPGMIEMWFSVSESSVKCPIYKDGGFRLSKEAVCRLSREGQFRITYTHPNNELIYPKIEPVEGYVDERVNDPRFTPTSF